jgi:hypothetical protein
MNMETKEYPKRIVYLDREMIAELYYDAIGVHDERNKLPRGDFSIEVTQGTDVCILKIEEKIIPVLATVSLGEHGESVISLTTCGEYAK